MKLLALRKPFTGVKMLFGITCLLLFCIFHVANNFFIYPWHASCRIKWSFPLDCDVVRSQLIAQMNAWEGDANCGQVSPSCPQLPCGQNCLYQFKNTDNKGTVTATHLTPVKRYTDNLTFKFESHGSGRCQVEAYSSSALWYAYLDMGTNYCNLRNLVDGSGLSAKNGFTENTKNAVCTQYESRDCSRF